MPPAKPGEQSIWVEILALANINQLNKTVYPLTHSTRGKIAELRFDKIVHKAKDITDTLDGEEVTTTCQLELFVTKTEIEKLLGNGTNRFVTSWSSRFRDRGKWIRLRDSIGCNNSIYGHKTVSNLEEFRNCTPGLSKLSKRPAALAELEAIIEEHPLGDVEKLVAWGKKNYDVLKDVIGNSRSSANTSWLYAYITSKCNNITSGTHSTARRESMAKAAHFPLGTNSKNVSIVDGILQVECVNTKTGAPPKLFDDEAAASIEKYSNNIFSIVDKVRQRKQSSSNGRLTIGQEDDLLSFVTTHAALIQEMLQDRLPDLDVLDILQRMMREGHNLEYILSQLKLACDNCELADEMCVQIESFIFQLRSNHLSPSLSPLAATATLPTPSNNSTAMESDTSTSNVTVTSSASIVISASAEMDTTKTTTLSFLAQYEKAKVLHESSSKSNDTTITLTSTCSQVERRLKKEDPRFKDSTLHIRSRTRSKKGKGKGKDKKGKRKSPPEEPPKFGLENKAPEPVKDDLLKACVQSAAVDADGNVDPKLLAQALDAGYSKYFVLGKVEEHLDSIKHTKPPAAKKAKMKKNQFVESVQK